jgi:hypothetical protein
VQEAVRELAQPVMDAAALASGVHVELSMGSTRVVASRILNDGGWLHTGLQNRKRLGEKNPCTVRTRRFLYSADQV